MIVENSPLNVSKENSVGLFLRLAALHMIDIDTIVDEVQEKRIRDKKLHIRYKMLRWGRCKHFHFGRDGQ